MVKTKKKDFTNSIETLLGLLKSILLIIIIIIIIVIIIIIIFTLFHQMNGSMIYDLYTG